MNLAEKIAKYDFKVTMKKIGTIYHIKTDPAPHYITLALMLHNDGYAVNTDITSETIIVKGKRI